MSVYPAKIKDLHQMVERILLFWWRSRRGRTLLAKGLPLPPTDDDEGYEDNGYYEPQEKCEVQKVRPQCVCAGGGTRGIPSTFHVTTGK